MKKVFYFFLFVISILNINCNLLQTQSKYTNIIQDNVKTKRYIPVYVDKTFSESDKLAIDQSIKEWNYVLNGQIVIEVVSYNFDMEPELILKARNANGFLILNVDSSNSAIPDEQTSGTLTAANKGKVLAWCDRIGGNVMKVVRDRITTDDIKYIMLHEIGHLLGAQHVDDNQSLMYPYYSKIGYLCVDGGTARVIADRYNLNFAIMNYCIAKY